MPQYFSGLRIEFRYLADQRNFVVDQRIKGALSTE
jgi:hypothetical protein